VAGTVLSAFQKRIVHRQPTRFLKALSATLRHLSSYRVKGFELAGFEKLSANSKAFGAKQLRTY
jgi:hypothetical protein